MRVRAQIAQVSTQSQLGMTHPTRRPLGFVLLNHAGHTMWVNDLED